MRWVGLIVKSENEKQPVQKPKREQVNKKPQPGNKK
nr:MAG TPA: hypothetical protein [Caudoviricetes sp.]